MGVHFHSQFRNPLAYPAGYAPGFDPNHVAGTLVRFSGVASPGNFISLSGGKITGTIIGTPTAAIFGSVGPSTLYTSSTDASTISGLSTATDLVQTIACIVIPNGGASTQVFYSTSNNGTGGFHLAALASGSLVFSVTGVANTDSAIVLTSGVPYFIITSFISGTKTLFLVKNLLTQVITFVSAGGLTSANPASGTNVVGNYATGSFPGKAYVAAVMNSACYLDRSQMLQWAADPWSFWYPNPGDNWIAAQAAAGFPYWGVQNNNFVIGTGVQ